MNLKEYIQQVVFLSRLKEKGCLVIYDPTLLYKDLIYELSNDKIDLIDVSLGSIEARENAWIAFKNLANSNHPKDGFIIYIPKNKPLLDKEKQIDPFSIYIDAGAVFPKGDEDSFHSLCMKYKPDCSVQINQLFKEHKDSLPSFELIDSIGQGFSWTILKNLFKKESSLDILLSFLKPSTVQSIELQKSDVWMNEANQFFLSTIGWNGKINSNDVQIIQNELWRFVLFSEFVFDLPIQTDLPFNLALIEHANMVLSPFIYEVCDVLRRDPFYSDLYLMQAEKIERELYLMESCYKIQDLGERDTFPFEERTYFQKAIQALLNDDIDTVKILMKRNESSIWIKNGEIQVQWDIIRAIALLRETCIDIQNSLPQHSKSIDSLIQFYITNIRELDRLHREMEQVISNNYEYKEQFDKIIEVARLKYNAISLEIHSIFVRFIESTSYPIDNILNNNLVFDKFIAEKLKEKGKRIAFILVDALRYELGVSLQKNLPEHYTSEITYSCANLPSITLVGMASLLPYGNKLTLKSENEKLIPMIEDAVVSNVSQRMNYIQKIYGDRFYECELNKFFDLKKETIQKKDLLVLRSFEIDENLENNFNGTLELIPKVLNKIRNAINRLNEWKFHEVVIATDHGFILNTHSITNESNLKPSGNWTFSSSRFLMGDGSSDSNNIVATLSKFGIKGDFSQISFPKTLISYKSGQKYYHGGLSIQECLLPILTIKLNHKIEKNTSVHISLSYKNGLKYITTRVPIFTISLNSENMFNSTDYEILLEAYSQEGIVIGRAKQGGIVDASTQTFYIQSGNKLQVGVQMDNNFEGIFILRALEPNSRFEYARLEMETDYLA